MPLNKIRELILNNDYDGIRQALSENPALANEGIPYDEANQVKAHPLHRICDAVFIKKLTDKEAVKIAKLFLEYGANINGNGLVEKQDTPLLAACSLFADEVALLYIDKGADIHHPGCHGGTALHWAAWCGRERVVKRLLEMGAELNKLCIDFKATPLFWAVHGLKNGGHQNTDHQLDCIRILIEAGATRTTPNANGATIFDLVSTDDKELKELLDQQ
jgi:hypothetical protein